MINYTTPIAESNSFIVLDKYTKEWQRVGWGGEGTPT